MNLNKIIREEVAQLNETAGKNMPDAFFDQVVQKLGGTPTAEKRRFFNAWKRAEGTNAKNNPLATTWDKQVTGQTDFNMVGVKNYPDQETGVSATVNTLTKGIGTTAYKDLVAKLQRDTTAEDLANTPAAFKSWSGKPDYVANVLGFKQTTDKEENPDEIEEIDPKTDSDEALIDKIQFWLDFAGFVPFIGDAVDLINGLIYVIRGRYWDAVLSGIALIPGVGSAVAVPMRVATKAAKKTLGSGAIKILAAGGPRFQKWLVKLIKSGKVDANILEQVAESGDDVAKMIQDASSKLSNVPGASKISKYTDEYIKLMKGRLDDIGKAAKASKKTATKLDKAVDMLGKLAKRTIPLSGTLRRLVNFTMSKKLVRGVTSPSVLNGMRKGVQSKFITKISKNPKIIDGIVSQTNKFNRKQFDSIFDFMSNNKIKLPGNLGNVKNLNATQLQSVIKSLDPKQTKSLLNHIAKNKDTFSGINKSLNKYKAAYVEQGISQIKNLSFKRGAGKFLWNTNDKIFSNINLPKFLSKSLYMAAALLDADNPELKSAGEDLQEAGIKQVELLATVSLSEPGDEQAQKEIMNQQDAAAVAQEKADRALNSIDSIDVEELSERDKELLNMLIQQYID